MGRLLALLVILAIASIPGALCVTYVVEFWAAFAGHAVDLPMVLNPLMLLSGAILSEIAIPAAAVTWLLHFVIA